MRVDKHEKYAVQSVLVPAGACSQPGFHKKLRSFTLSPISSPPPSPKHQSELREKIEKGRKIDDASALWSCKDFDYVAEAKAKTIQLRHRTLQLLKKVDAAELPTVEPVAQPVAQPVLETIEDAQTAMVNAPVASTMSPPTSSSPPPTSAAPGTLSTSKLKRLLKTGCDEAELPMSNMPSLDNHEDPVVEEVVDEEEFNRRRSKVRSIRNSMRARLMEGLIMSPRGSRHSMEKTGTRGSLELVDDSRKHSMKTGPLMRMVSRSSEELAPLVGDSAGGNEAEDEDDDDLDFGEEDMEEPMAIIDEDSEVAEEPSAYSRSGSMRSGSSSRRSKGHSVSSHHSMHHSHSFPPKRSSRSSLYSFGDLLRGKRDSHFAIDKSRSGSIRETRSSMKGVSEQRSSVTGSCEQQTSRPPQNDPVPRRFSGPGVHSGGGARRGSSGPGDHSGGGAKRASSGPSGHSGGRRESKNKITDHPLLFETNRDIAFHSADVLSKQPGPREGHIRLYSKSSEGGVIVKVFFPGTSRKRELTFERVLRTEELNDVYSWGRMTAEDLPDQYEWLSNLVVIEEAEDNQSKPHVGLRGFDERVAADKKTQNSLASSMQSLFAASRQKNSVMADAERSVAAATPDQAHPSKELRAVASDHGLTQHVVSVLHDWYDHILGCGSKLSDEHMKAFMRKIHKTSGRPEMDDKQLDRILHQVMPPTPGKTCFERFVDLLAFAHPPLHRMSASDIRRFAEVVERKEAHDALVRAKGAIRWRSEH